jgi:hypothetical protein
MNAVPKPRSRPRPRVGIQTPLAVTLAEQFKRGLRSNDSIIHAVINDCLVGLDPDVIKRSASGLMRELEQRVYRDYMESQQVALDQALRSVLRGKLPEGAGAADAIDLIARNARAFDEFFLSVAQGRKKRAGGVLEAFYEALFRAARYPHHVVRTETRAALDFVFPSIERLEERPEDCVVLVAKRMLRDGWRHLAPKLTSEARVYVATLDGTISDWDLQNFLDAEATIVVPEHVRASAYADQSHVISIESFLLEVLDPQVEDWVRRAVVP